MMHESGNKLKDQFPFLWHFDLAGEKEMFLFHHIYETEKMTL